MISCNVNNCSHNSTGTCYANSINISGNNVSKCENTCCGSFLDKSSYSNLTNSCSDNSACKTIICNVGTCRYNSGKACKANGIQVNGQNVNLYNETNCSTFKLK